ncbi:hypothetical protein [Kitasatospora sp. KL5]|uniref:hypothetical protein n=1 Tax=Kitasatospora sp. KL5 TaxID=3425125 RepID=UPI003D6E0241
MASKDVELGRQAAEVADRVVSEMRSADSVLRTAGLGDLPDHAINGGMLLSALPQDVLNLTQVRAMTTLGATWRLWGRAKNVYAIHPDMVSELWSYGVGQLPGELFRNLRHPNPAVVFAQPPVITLTAGGHGRLLAIFFCGRLSGERLLCLTSDGRMGEVAVIAIAEPLAEDGTPLPPPAGARVAPLEYIHCTIPVEAGVRFTAGDLAGRLARKAGLDEPTDGHRDVVTRVLQIAVYLCSSKAEIALPPAPRSKAAKRGRQRKPGETFLRVGWRLGPMLKAARLRAQETRRSGPHAAPGVLGRRQYPHQRGGHQKTVWKGPGRTVADSVLVAPYWVSQDLLDGDGAAPEGIVRPVR